MTQPLLKNKDFCETGSKSVISINLNRVIQDWYNSLNCSVSVGDKTGKPSREFIGSILTTDKNLQEDFLSYLGEILERIYKYHKAYNAILWDMYNSNLLPVYKAGFIDLNKQYLTIGLIGTSASAEFLGYKITDNSQYAKYCQLIFKFIKNQNELHHTDTETFNTEMVPKLCGHLKSFLIDSKLLIGQRGASRRNSCSVRD